MSAADEIQIIDRYLPHIASVLGVPVSPGCKLNRAQIAKVARLCSSESLAVSACRGVTKGYPRWIAFKHTIGTGTHKVPAEQVARWLAIEAGMLPMPMPLSAAPSNPAGAGGAFESGSKWISQFHFCEG